MCSLKAHRYNNLFQGVKMRYILQIDFPHNGPFKEEFSEAFSDLAHEISTQKGLIWKIWTENEETQEAGGIYLFETLDDANTYLDFHTKRLKSFGYANIRGKIFSANEKLSKITKANL